MSIKTFMIKLLTATSLVTLTEACALNDISPYDKVPIDLSKSGSVSTTLIKINSEDRYIFSLEFKYEPGDVKDLRDSAVYMGLLKFLADYPDNPQGTIIPLKLTISKLDNGQKSVHDKEYFTMGSNRSKHFSLYREITIIHLQPGRYAIRLESLKDFPDFPKTTVTLEVHRFFAK